MINRGSYMRARVLSYLFNEFGKDIKCEASRAYCLFLNKFNKFNDTREGMLDSNII